MIACRIEGRNFEFDDKMKAYVGDKIGGLEKYLPRSVRRNTSCMVVLESDPNGREDNRFVCDAVMAVAGTQLVSREGTINIYAAIDIVEAKLKVQMVKYKEKHALEPRRGRMLARWLGRRGGVSEPGVEAGDLPE
jgi:ribosomal subunit interface protein